MQPNEPPKGEERLRSAQRVDSSSLGRLHPEYVGGRGQIRAFLEAVRRSRLVLVRGATRSSARETARIEDIADASLSFAVENLATAPGDQIFLNVALGGRPHFFAVTCLESLAPDKMRTDLPGVIYRSERRDRVRNPVDSTRDIRARVGRGGWLRASILDRSPGGIGIGLPGGVPARRGDRIEIDLKEQASSRRTLGEVRNIREIPERPGWRRIGIEIAPAPPSADLALDRRDYIVLPTESASSARVPKPAESPRPLPSLPADTVRLVEYRNQKGEPLRALLDTVGSIRGAPVAVIPPAWGHTKETLLPLAATILATCEAAGASFSVLRFDGARRRGESYNDPDCLAPGMETKNFTFSQAVADLEATVAFAREELGASGVVLVTFSAAAVEGRRVAARDHLGRVLGWVSVVGAPDPQSLIRVISGGIDYFAGYEKGARFGLQQVQGILLDVDNAARDAIENGLAFLDDAKRDLATIRAPVTWIHGRNDAWMDPERVRSILRFGDGARRRLIEIPTGHQLRTSQEALETFELIAAEVAQMGLGREVDPAVPDRQWLRTRRRIEERRRPEPVVDLRGFWRDYLMGRGQQLGMELIVNTAAHQGLMHAQVEALRLGGGLRLLDLGAGVGTLPRFLFERGRHEGLWIVEVDYVVEALRRGRQRAGHNGHAWLAADLSLAGARSGIPIASASVDRVLASLLLNYVADPSALLSEIYRVLRPGGRLVLSSLRRDADVSQICVSGVAELRSGVAHKVFGVEGERNLAASLHSFVNDAGKLLDLEQRGLFRFWSGEELVELVEAAGFRRVATRPVFGSPPQAHLLEAVHPGNRAEDLTRP